MEDYVNAKSTNKVPASLKCPRIKTSGAPLWPRRKHTNIVDAFTKPPLNTDGTLTYTGRDRCSRCKRTGKPTCYVRIGARACLACRAKKSACSLVAKNTSKGSPGTDVNLEVDDDEVMAKIREGLFAHTSKSHSSHSPSSEFVGPIGPPIGVKRAARQLGSPIRILKTEGSPSIPVSPKRRKLTEDDDGSDTATNKPPPQQASRTIRDTIITPRTRVNQIHPSTHEPRSQQATPPPTSGSEHPSYNKLVSSNQPAHDSGIHQQTSVSTSNGMSISDLQKRISSLESQIATSEAEITRQQAVIDTMLSEQDTRKEHVWEMKRMLADYGLKMVKMEREGRAKRT